MAQSVLVVDDDASFRLLATRMLSGWGFSVVGQAADVAHAVRQAVELQPDIAVVDIGLPDGDGFGLTEQLRAMPRPPRVVLISADWDRTTAPEAQRAGASGFVPKSDLSGARFRRLLEESVNP